MRTLSLLAAALVVAAAATSAAQEPPWPPGMPPGGPPGMPRPGAWKPEELPAPRDVAVTTDDGMKLAATFWPVKEEGGAGAVLLHMYGSDRKAWAPLVDHLRARGIA